MQTGWSNILTVTCIVIAGVVEAGQQALNGAPNIAALVPGFIRGSFWNYIPLAFLIAAGAIHIAGRIFPTKANEDKKITSKAEPAAASITTAIAAKAPSVPIAVGLTLDYAQAETVPDRAPWTFKFKLRVYWTNDGDETIHLGKPLWRGIAIQGDNLTSRYQLRKLQSSWGDETEETDVTPGQRCRVWLGLDPALRDGAVKMLDEGALGLLVIPVSTPNWTVDVCIRPRDRGLKQFNAQEYVAQQKAVHDRYIVLSQETKALLSFLRARRIVSAVDAADHFKKYDLPNAEKTLSDLRNDSVPFLDLSGSEIKLNPILERIVTEIVKKDEMEFINAVDNMPTKTMGDRIKNESGFKGRYNALASKQPW